MFPKNLFLLCLCAIAFPSYAGKIKVSTEERCRPYRSVEIPKADVNGGLPTNGCSAEDYYFGVSECARSNKPNYRLARLKGFVERPQFDRSNTPYDGLPILMMIYANGKGVPRNYALASKFACEMGEDGLELRLDSLELASKAYANNERMKDIDVCSMVPDYIMEATCVVDNDNHAYVPQREKRLRNIVSKWSSQDMEVYWEVRKKSNDFFGARCDREVDQTGASRMRFSYEESRRLEDGFVELMSEMNLNRLRKSRKLISEEEELQKTFLYMQASDWKYGTVTAEDIAITQKYWLEYRDAWLALARAKGQNEDAWRERLTVQRFIMLKELQSQGE